MKNKIPSSSKNTFFELIKLIEEQNNKNKNKMARTKTAKAEPKPKTYTFTEEQWSKFKEAAHYATEIRRSLEDLKGEEDLSTIMFEVGKSNYMASECEDILDELLGLYDEDDNGWDYNEDDDM